MSRTMVGSILGICLSFANPAFSEEPSISSVTIPISIDLDYLQERLNAELPSRLASINENNMLCVPAEWTSWSYPCFRGIKWYTCTGKTKVSPDIHCDVTGFVDRRGGVTLSGQGGTLDLALSVHASVSAKAIVQETATADATFFVSATPMIDENWNPTLVVDSNFRWDNRPELKLFNFIKITIGSKVEPKLLEKMKEFESQIPGLVSELEIRGEVDKIWKEIQKPIKISDSPSVFSLFKPTRVAFSGLNVDGRNLSAKVTLAGETRVFVGEAPQVTPIPLLPLVTGPSDEETFSLSIPILVEEREIQNTIDKKIGSPVILKIEDENLEGTLEASNIRVEFDASSGILLRADVKYDNRSTALWLIDLFNWFDFDGVAEFEIIPALDNAQSVVFTESIRLSSNTNSTLADTLVSVLNLPIVRDQFADMIRYDFTADLEKSMIAANAALQIEIADGARISGVLESAGPRDLVVGNDHLSVIVRADGRVQANIGP